MTTPLLDQTNNNNKSRNYGSSRSLLVTKEPKKDEDSYFGFRLFREDANMQVEYMLLNHGCGGKFCFSDAFMSEYNKRCQPLEGCFHGEIKGGDDFDSSGSTYSVNRCDPVAIAIFDEKGSSWCSDDGDGPSSMTMMYKAGFPAGFAQYASIKENADGSEELVVDFNHALACGITDILGWGDGTLDDVRAWKAQIAFAEAFHRTLE